VFYFIEKEFVIVHCEGMDFRKSCFAKEPYRRDDILAKETNNFKEPTKS